MTVNREMCKGPVNQVVVKFLIHSRWWAKDVVHLFLLTIIRLLTILYHALYQEFHILRPLPFVRLEHL
jgi:hypothetical protein